MSAPAADNPAHSASPNERAHSLRRAAFLTAGMGIAQAVLFLLCVAPLATIPGPKASDAEILGFYSSKLGLNATSDGVSDWLSLRS